MKNIIIKAYTEVNLGDDLFIKLLCERYPKTNFFISTPSTSSKPFLKINNLKLVTKIRYIDRLLAKIGLNISLNNIITQKRTPVIDGTIHIGGSIFIQSKNWKHKFNSYLKEIKKSKNFFVIGSNFGPFADNEFYESYQLAFSEMNDVCLRDKKSFEKFNHLNNTRLAPDVVFNLNSEKVKKNSSEKKYVVFSLIDLSWRSGLKDCLESYENSIVEICKSLVNSGYNVKLMSFCKKEGDEKAAKRVKSMLNDSRVSIYFYRGNIEESLEILNSSQGIIASRFHAMVLGWVFKKPTVPYIYSSKMTNVLDDINYDGIRLFINNKEEINSDAVLRYIKQKHIVDVNKQKEDAEYQFLELDNFLMKDI